MKKISALIFLFLAYNSLLNAQHQITIKGEGNIVEQDNDFYIWQKIELKGEGVPIIQLTDIETKTVLNENKQSLTRSDFIPDILITTERKTRYANLKIPVYKNVDNKTEQLTDYNISIHYPATQTNDSPLKPTDNQNEESVLAKGDWYKIAIPSRGIYKIDYNFLEQLGLNPAQINPASIRIFGNGGTILPETVSDDQPDDLIENAIWVSTTGSSFGKNDYILFYANGPILWTGNPYSRTFSHTNNYYEDKSYYFLTIDGGSGKRIDSKDGTLPADQVFKEFNEYTVYNKDSFNIGAIGRTWWSNQMNSSTGFASSSKLKMNLGGFKDTVLAKVHVANTNDNSPNILSMKINNQQVQTFNLVGNSSGVYYYDLTQSFYFAPSKSDLDIEFNYNPRGNGSAYLDFIELNYKRPLNFSGNQLNFRNWETTTLPTGDKAGFEISNAPSGIMVWDITQALDPVRINGNYNNGNYTFSYEADTMREFIAFNGSNFSTPEYIGRVANQNLHGYPQTDLLIITNQELKPAAEELAEFHRQYDGKSVIVETVDRIYNEFSSGGQDIGGIRNFIKMFYDRAQSEDEMVDNVLLFGTASYDYKDRIPDNTNHVPTYETIVSSNEDYSFSTDDYFVILDAGENIMTDNNFLDAGIGRIPAANMEEARNVIAKIKHYVSPQSFGPWKNNIAFVADDHDFGNIGNMNHLNDCEVMSNRFMNDDLSYNVYKIYADAFNKMEQAGGTRYPDVNKAINDRMYNGTLVMSYSGHGSAERWAHEAILTPNDYDNWENLDRLPIMYTGTCDFGRFDNPKVRYAGVKILLNPNGGSIAMITTTQAVYQSGNRDLGTRYLAKQLGEKNSRGQHLTFGEALRKAKNDISTNGTYWNKIKYVLLGDPALRIPIPVLEVHTDSLQIKKENDYLTTNTLKALGQYTLHGSIKDAGGNVQQDFNGSVFITILDKPTTIQTLNTAPGVTPTFKIQNNIVAKARAQVKNGVFSAGFIVPKDINYDLGKGKVSFYAQSDTKDASGIDEDIWVGGFESSSEFDDQPPVVEVFIDDEKFRNGGITDPNPNLYIKLSDDHGINVSGGSVGHDLVAYLDEDIQNPIVLNDYFQTIEGDFRKGFVYFPLQNLPEGKHTIRVKAWDTYNNSGEGTVEFEVSNKEKGFISELYNYPNPVTDKSNFVFQHNQSGEDMTVSLQLFNTYGAMVWNFDKEMKPEGNRTEIAWDGTGNNGQSLAKGVYFYRLIVKTKKGIEAKAYQKLVLNK